MAGNAMLYGVIGFLIGVIAGNKFREIVDPLLGQVGVSIPSLYASYPAGIDYPSTTASSMAGAVYERDYGNANELHINHLPMSG